MGSVKTSQIEPNNGVDLNLISGPGGYVYVNGQIITGSGSVIIGPQGDMGPTGSIGDTGATGATGPKGDTGEQGIPGIDGAVLPAGLTWSGTWSGTQSYLKNYVVGYASASWWSKNNIEGKPFPLTPNSPPDIDSINWSLLATQGPVGIQGIQGPTGPQGIQGPTGIGLQGIQGIQGPTGPGIASMVSYYTTNVQDALDDIATTLTNMVVNFTTSNGSFTTISSTYSNFVSGSASSFTSNTIVSDIATFMTMSAINTNIDNLVVNNLTATNTNITSLTVSNVNINNLTATSSTIIIGNINDLTTTIGNITSLTTTNLITTNSTVVNSNILGTMSINRINNSIINNNTSKLLGLSGSQLVGVTTFVNSVTSSNNSIKITATGSNYSYDFSIGLTSSNDTIKLSSISEGLFDLQIATDSVSTSGSSNFVNSGTLYNELLLKQNLPTGFVAGLTLSITPGDNTKFDISFGGFLVTDYTDVFNVTSTIVQTPLAGLTGISPLGLTTSTSTYIALDENLNVIQSLSPFTDADRRQYCIIGVVVHSNLSTINVVNEQKAPIIAPTNQLHDFIKAVGFLNLSGNVYSPVNSATGSDLSMKKSAGEIWGLGVNGGDYTDPHRLVIPQQATFSFRLRKSVSPVSETLDLLSLNGNLNYETIISSTNSTLTTIPSNRFGIFHGTLFQSGLTRMQYPQRVYNTLQDAISSAHEEEFVIENNIRDNGIFRFYLIIQGGTTNFNDPLRYRFMEVSKFGNVSGSAGSSLTFANIISTLGYTPESNVNKQDSLLFDGTGQKYPTVDAVNNALSIKKAGSYIITASQNITNYTTGSIYLSNNGAGGIFSANPNGVSSVWSDDYLVLTDLNEGDMVSIRFEIDVTTIDVNQIVDIQLVLAEGSASEYSIPISNNIVLKDATKYSLSFNSEFCIKNSDYIAEKGRIVFSSNSSCDIDMRDIYIKVLLYS